MDVELPISQQVILLFDDLLPILPLHLKGVNKLVLTHRQARVEWALLELGPL